MRRMLKRRVPLVQRDYTGIESGYDFVEGDKKKARAWTGGNCLIAKKKGTLQPNCLEGLQKGSS